MKRRPAALIVASTLVASGSASGQTPYRQPPKEVVKLVDAAPPPSATVSPRRDAIALVEYEANPPIELLGRPYHGLAGVRVDPELGAERRTTRFTSITVRPFTGNKTVKVALPAGARIGFPAWSPDGKKLAFTRDLEDGVELWVADVASGQAAPVGKLRLNDILGDPFDWMNDSRNLLVRLVPAGRGQPPERPRRPLGPIVDEASGKTSRPPTYQDLLRNPHDELLFEHFGATQLARVDSATGAVSPIGKPGLYLGARFSPDDKYLLATRIKRPFSYRVPAGYFSRTLQILDAKGTVVRTLADLPVSDEVPTQGVPTGPRAAQWQMLHPARVIWAEALDGGDPLKKVPHRDALFALAAPFSARPKELLKIQHRYGGLEWTATRDRALLTETDRDRRWRTTAVLDLERPAQTRKVLFDLSQRDAYNDPGTGLRDRRADGQTVLLQDGEEIYLSGVGASPQGNRPFLDKLNLTTAAKQRLHHSAADSQETVITFVGPGRTTLLTRYESRSQPPNYYLLDLASGKRTALTDYKDPAPQLTGVQRQILTYRRADGIPLSGMLYLPPGHKKGTRLPVLIWAYPLEYSDASTAGQVRAAPNAFVFYRGASPLFFLTQGYAVLMDATMPVVGDPETMNDTFVPQIVGAAKAAVDKLTEMGVADPNRLLVSGHSYGAFMTANLLAHSDLFAAGIARSGAYNRSLTPFGFQSERRSFWEASSVYMNVSPFTHATKIKTPLLLLHGAADNNSGTHTMQSERFYDAVKGGGGTVRLVLLPHEAHGYLARESILHALAEMFDWADKYVKHRKPGKKTKLAAAD
jgi:dipeptidyl aminopeptidase/acylaminoacyl peptidase